MTASYSFYRDTAMTKLTVLLSKLYYSPMLCDTVSMIVTVVAMKGHY
jgi:hypothetical protein